MTEWLALGLSQDDVMGDDLIIYCHPFMDRKQFPWGMGTNSRYPENIGVGFNKYFTPGSGKQAYDGDQTKFGKKLGSVKNGRVKWEEVSGSVVPRWGVIHCKADITTYILLQEKGDIISGVELDMEKERTAIVFLANGHCLQQECLGDHPDNPDQQLRDTARKTTPMAKHKLVWFTKKQVPLFQHIQRGGATKTGGMGNAFWIVFLLIIATAL